jgi:triosephosphate isomerase
MKYIFANWKQHFSYNETIQKFDQFMQGLNSLIDKKIIAVGIAVSYESLQKVAYKNTNSALWIGAQSCSPFYQGSHTGEVSARSLKEIGAKFVVIGHSERRLFLHETEEMIALQMKSALAAGLLPILCVGESLCDKNNNKSYEVLRRQIVSAFAEIDNKFNKKIIIAYEPQYAIGTGILPKLHDIEKIMASLQNLKNEASLNLHDTPLLYGGSVDEKNYESVLKTPFVQGLLIGAASLHLQSFAKIVSGSQFINKKYVSKISKNYNVVENI